MVVCTQDVSVSASVTVLAEIMPTKARDGVGAAPNMGAGTQLSLASILHRASTKEEYVRKIKWGKKS